MDDFEKYLKNVGEVGFVEEIIHSVIYASGLPGARPYEAVIFENGEIGQVISLSPDKVEVLLLGTKRVTVGMRLARTDDMLQVPLSDEVLGRVVNSMGVPLDDKGPIKTKSYSAIDTQPHGIVGRKQVEKFLETGVTIVDTIIPLGKGQRELVIGDRKTGKTDFLYMAMANQANMGSVCIYAVIGQKQSNIKELINFIKEANIADKVIVVATQSSDSSGLIYLTPFSAMTIAEHFRDKGMDVLLILDDMTTHARVYREISLLANRFPGRSSYPGDIFYLHSRIMERAGNFTKGSITALPVAETVLGDLSGYLQTNLMGMTDGHIYFDIDLYNKGQRPAVSPFLSVTRVGHYPQTPLQRDLSRTVLSFLVTYEKMKQFIHFGAEAGETVMGTIELGEKLDSLFNQPSRQTIPVNINALILGGVWAGRWSEIAISDMESDFSKLISNYIHNENYKKQVDEKIEGLAKFSDLVNLLRRDSMMLNPD